MELTRRSFLYSISSTALLWTLSPYLALASKKNNQLKGYILSDGFPEKIETNWGPFLDAAHIPANSPSGVLVLDSHFNTVKRLEIPFLGHKYFQNPQLHTQVICTERKGYWAANLDIQKNRVEKIKAPEGTIFYGHGFFSLDGKIFFATGLDRVRGKGVLFEYEASQMKLQRTLETGGLYPHDVQLSDDGKTCILANSGIPKNARLKYEISKEVSPRASIVVLDYHNGKMLQHFPTGTDCGIAHFRFISKNEIFAVGTPETGNMLNASQALVMNIETGKVDNLSHIPGFDKVTGELNNPAYIHERHSVAFNCSGAKSIFEISLKEKTITNSIATNSITPLFEFKPSAFVTASAKGGFERVKFNEGKLEGIIQPSPFKFAAGPHFNEIILPI